MALSYMLGIRRSLGKSRTKDLATKVSSWYYV